MNYGVDKVGRPTRYCASLLCYICVDFITSTIIQIPV